MARTLSFITWSGKEARHVFIENGLKCFQNRKIAILEIGFGTGLNAFITYLESPKLGLSICYEGVEAYPVEKDELSELNYISQLDAEAHKDIFKQMHQVSWDKEVVIAPHFSLNKNENNSLNRFRMIPAFISFIMMLLALEFNLNCGLKVYLKKCMKPFALGDV